MDALGDLHPAIVMVNDSRRTRSGRDRNPAAPDTIRLLRGPR
jgi:hypothetical protein